MRQSKDKEKAKHVNNAFHLFCLVSGSSDLHSPVYIVHVWFLTINCVAMAVKHYISAQ